MSNKVTKEITLCLPPKLVEALAESYPEVHLSEQIRRTLLGAEKYADCDLSSIQVPYAEGKRKNFYLPLVYSRHYDYEASKRGQSVSGYLVHLLSNVLSGEGYLDLPLLWEKPLAEVENPDPTHKPKFEFSLQLIAELNRHGQYRPFNVAWVSQVILTYLKDGLEGKAVGVSVKDYYFHQRHQQQKESMKVRVSPVINDILYQVAKRMGTTRMMVLTQAILYHFSKV